MCVVGFFSIRLFCLLLMIINEWMNIHHMVGLIGWFGWYMPPLSTQAIVIIVVVPGTLKLTIKEIGREKKRNHGNKIIIIQSIREKRMKKNGFLFGFEWIIMVEKLKKKVSKGIPTTHTLFILDNFYVSRFFRLMIMLMMMIWMSIINKTKWQKTTNWIFLHNKDPTTKKNKKQIPIRIDL